MARARSGSGLERAVPFRPVQRVSVAQGKILRALIFKGLGAMHPTGCHVKATALEADPDSRRLGMMRGGMDPAEGQSNDSPEEKQLLHSQAVDTAATAIRRAASIDTLMTLC
jgi:hypothetical protein